MYEQVQNISTRRVWPCAIRYAKTTFARTTGTRDKFNYYSRKREAKRGRENWSEYRECIESK